MPDHNNIFIKWRGARLPQNNKIPGGNEHEKIAQAEMKEIQCGPSIEELDGHIAELENYLASGEGNPTGIQNRIKRCEEQKKERFKLSSLT